MAVPPSGADDPLDTLSSGFLEQASGGGQPVAAAPASGANPLPAGAIPAGTLIGGRYEITGGLPGDGRNPEYSAIDTETQQPVIVRFIPELFELAEKDDVRRVLREARACSAIRHANLVHLLKVEAASGKVYFVLEIPDGRTGADAIAGGPMSPLPATRAVRDAAAALAVVHKAGLVHRNVSPANIVLDPDGPARLKGLGLTGVLEELQNFRLGVPLADPKYTAPELFQHGECDGREDIYCLGATWYTLLTGRLPFEADTSMQILHKHCTAPVPDPAEIVPNLPASCRKILNVAMAKEPSQRFRDAETMIGALDLVIEELTADAATAMPDEPQLPEMPVGGTTLRMGAGRTGSFGAVRPGKTMMAMRPIPAAPAGGRLSPAVLIGGGVAAVVVIVVVVIFMMRGKGGKLPPPTTPKTKKAPGGVLEPPPDDPPGVHLRTIPEESSLPPDTPPLAVRPTPPDPPPPTTTKTTTPVKKVEPPPPTPPPAAGSFPVKISFRPAAEAPPPGYLVDDGSPYGPRRGGHSYGWSADHRDVVRKRGMNKDAKLDTLCHFHAGARWEIAVPNGTYDVTVCIGDAQHPSKHTLNVEGNNFWKTIDLAAGKFLTSTKTVGVRDGRLTLDQGSAVEKETRIVYVEIAVK